MLRTGKYHAVEFGINQRINSMIHLGLKKADMIAELRQNYLANGGTESDWQQHKNYIISKNPYIRSVGSIEVMREAGRVFCAYCAENGIKKYEKITRDDLCNYLKYRQSCGMSAWSLSRDLHFANKVFSENITKAEVGLPSRLTSAIKRGRNGQPANRPGLMRKYQHQIEVVKATGIRRSSVTRITKADFIYKGEEPVQLRVREKGGKERCCFILPGEHRERVKELLRTAPDTGPIFQSYDRHINSHFFRHEYAVELLNMLQEQKDRGRDFYDAEIAHQGKISKHDVERYANGYHGFSLDVIAEASANLGHARAEIIKNYLY